MTEPQIIHGLPEEEYHSREELSSSGIADYIASPLLFWHRHKNPEGPVKEETAALSIGSAFHCLVLEPEKFSTYFHVAPEKMPDRRTKAGKEEYAELLEAAEGAQILDYPDYVMIMRMRDALMQHPAASSLIGSIDSAEASIFYEYLGVKMRSRIDGICKGQFIVDLKTTLDASYSGFSRSIRKYNYYMQAFLYSKAYEIATGEPPKAFYFVCVQKNSPYNIGVYEADSVWMKYAEAQLQYYLPKIADSISRDYWPDYNNNSITKLIAPEWVKDEIDILNNIEDEEAA